ncbi:unnamed protein product [Trichobilharzia regenti]|nr:unnamed protein product [Trichobilharzia regenti]
MNITLLMNETESIPCRSVNMLSDNMDDYTSLCNSQYSLNHNTNTTTITSDSNICSTNNNSINNHHTILAATHTNNVCNNVNELSTTDCTTTMDTMNNLNSNSTCASPNGSTLTMYGTQHRFKISPNAYHDLENGNNSVTMNNSNNSTRPDADVDSAFPPKKLYTDDIPVLMNIYCPFIKYFCATSKFPSNRIRENAFNEELPFSIKYLDNSQTAGRNKHLTSSKSYLESETEHCEISDTHRPFRLEQL